MRGLFNDTYAFFFSSDFLDKSICCWYQFELSGLVPEGGAALPALRAFRSFRIPGTEISKSSITGTHAAL